MEDVLSHIEDALGSQRRLDDAEADDRADAEEAGERNRPGGPGSPPGRQ